MKKKIILSLALVVALFVSNPAVVLAASSQTTGSIGGVTVTGNSSAYVASGSASTYMATYNPAVRVNVNATYCWYNVDNAQYYYMYPSNAGDSSTSVIADPNNEFCVTEYMEASHHASNGNDSWDGHTYASIY